jgi:aryl-alcohol dehydrogenase-like predicted oxidoreductase
MRYRRLGESDLEVSAIALGSWLTYGGGVADDQARACVDAAFDAGINFIDTANVYALGAAEQLLGEALAGRPRDSYVLATKLYFPMDDSGDNQGLSRGQVLKQIDESLRRLRTGFSEWNAAQIESSLVLSAERGLERFVSSQPQYSLLWREPEREVIPLCRANGISQIVWSPLAQGALTGKYRPGEPPPSDSRATSPRMGRLMDRWLDDDVLCRVQRLLPVAERLGLSPAQLALAWVLREDNVAAAIVGASRPDQVRENAAAADVSLDEATLVEIDAILADESR